jgi:catechol 2,3-dioxygenase-like lactoylglutathione lyase family enzyme
MSGAPAMIGFDHVHVYVPDRARAEVWYREVLGFSRVKEFEFWAPDGGPLFLKSATGNAHIALFERPAQACRSVIAFGVSAAAFMQWREHLSRALHGAELTMDDHDVSWSLYFRDPDGNPYEITTYEHAAVSRLLAGAVS